MMNHRYRVTVFSTLILVIICSLPLNAQQDQTQALIRKAQQATRNTDSLIIYGNQLLKMKDSLAIAEGYYAKGRAMRSKRRPDSMLVYFNKGYGYVPSRNLQSKLRLLTGISSSYQILKKPDSAIEYSLKAEKLAIQISDDRSLAASLSTRASALMDLGKYEESIDLLTEELRIQERFTPSNFFSTYSRIANSYLRLNRPEQAMKWLQKALLASENYPDPSAKGSVLQNIAKLHFDNKMLDSSRFYAKKLEQSSQRPNPFQEKAMYMLLTEIELEEDNLVKATEYLNKVDKVQLPGSNQGFNAGVLRIKVKLASKNGDLPMAEKLLDSVYQVLGGKVDARTLPILLDRTELYQLQGKYKEALETFSSYSAIKDSLKSVNDLSIIQNSLNEYQLEKKEEEIKAALAENESSRWIIIVLIFVATSIVLILFYIYKRYRNSKSKAQQLELQNEETLAAIKKLQHQLALAKKPESPSSILINSKHIVKLDQLEYVKSEGHYLDYFIQNENLPITERNTLKDRITELETGGFLQVHRSFVINIDKVKSIQSGLVVMETGSQIPLSRTFKQRLREEKHPLFA